MNRPTVTPVLLVNALRLPEGRAALMVIQTIEGTEMRKVYTVDGRLAERALQTLHTNGRPTNREMNLCIDDEGCVVSWDADCEG